MTDVTIATADSAAPAAPADGTLGYIADSAYAELPDADQELYSRTPGKDGAPSRWQLRSEFEKATAGDKPADQPDTGDAIDPATMQPGERIRLAGKDGAVFELDAADVSRLMEAHAAEALRKATLPADAAAYKAELPAAFKAPPGVELKIDDADPALADLKAWAHRNGWSQEQFSDVLGIYAAREARQAAMINAAAARQIELLGTNGSQRVDAVSQFLRSMVGDDLAKPMLNVMATEKIVRGYEKLMQRVASQGAANFSQQHRVPHEAARVSDAEYAAMTPGEKQAYSQQFDQSQFKADGPRVNSAGRRF